jgi:hypothetical protein
MTAALCIGVCAEVCAALCIGVCAVTELIHSTEAKPSIAERKRKRRIIIIDDTAILDRYF